MGETGTTQQRVAMRRANQLVVARTPGAAHLTIRCECGRSCGRWVSVASEAYESARSRGRFVTAKGHADLEGDRVVLERREYDVVEQPRQARSSLG
jgi:hypothetical protein